MSSRRRSPRVLLNVKRRCLVCDAETEVTEPSETDQIGPLCEQCHAPTERIAVLSRRVVIEPLVTLSAARLALWLLPWRIVSRTPAPSVRGSAVSLDHASAAVRIVSRY